LIDAINAGECKFVKLSADERKKRLKTYKAKIAAGELKAHERKTHSDARKKKKRKQQTDSSDEDEGNKGSSGHLSCKRQQTTSKSYVSDSDDNSEGVQ
jgi:uncharacterized membrane protein YukC